MINKTVRNNKVLRDSYNALSTKTFGLSFEPWYESGFWQEKHIPYAYVKNDQVIANVSVNLIDIEWNGQTKHFVELGTVMTAEEYRNQGLIRRIMEEIFKDYEKKCDGFFLFANDTVLDFYPKFGFQKAQEYQYSKTVNLIGNGSLQPFLMENKAAWEKLASAIDTSHPQGQFDLVNNSDLVLFYTIGFMKENVYYQTERDVYVIAEKENDEVFLHAVYAKEEIKPEEVLSWFDGSVKKVTLGFVPQDAEEYECSLLEEEDTTLFVKGFDLEGERVMFPTLAHT